MWHGHQSEWMKVTSLGSGNRGGHLRQASSLWLLDHMEMLFGAAGAARGSRVWWKALEEMALYQTIWFSSGTEVFQYVKNGCRLISACWLSALSVEKLIMKILLPRCRKDPVTCAPLHWSTSRTPRRAGRRWGQLVRGRDQVPNFCL